MTVLEGRMVLPATVGATATAAGVALSAAIASEGPDLDIGWRLAGLLGLWALAWVVAVACAFRLPKRVVVAGAILAALFLRLAALAGPPVLSTDLFRYGWDGRVQAAGLNPYEEPPASDDLRSLREDWLWPDAEGCAELGRSTGCTRMNRPSVRTIYPPLAQAWFAGVYKVAGIDARHKAWQVAGLVTDMALVALLPLVLRAWGKDERWTALYALSPFPVLEVVNNGHVDGLAALLVVVALWAAARRRPVWAGVVLGAAAGVKLYPALLLVALAGAVPAARRLRSLFAAGAAAMAVLAASYLPHVLSVGTQVLGYLPGYLEEERYTTGERFLLALSTPAVVAGMLAVIAWVILRRPQAPRAGATLMGALLLATTPVQPWYAVTLLAVATVAAAPAWAVVVVAGYPYFFAVVLDATNEVAVGRLSYGLALAAVVVGSALRRRTAKALSDDS